MNEKTYIGLVVKEPDTSFWVHFPDFKYCFTCGDTIENAEIAARDALDTHITGLVKDGYTVPPPSTLNDILAENDMNIVTILNVPVTIPDDAATNKIVPINSRRAAPKPS